MSILGDMGRTWMFIASAAVMLCVAILFWMAYPKTKYAPGFSEANFARVTNGMSIEGVTELLGEPVRIEWHDINGSAMFAVVLSKTVRPPPNKWIEVRMYSADEIGSRFDKGYCGRSVTLSNDVVVSVERYLVWGKSVWKGF